MVCAILKKSSFRITSAIFVFDPFVVHLIGRALRNLVDTQSCISCEQSFTRIALQLVVEVVVLGRAGALVIWLVLSSGIVLSPIYIISLSIHSHYRITLDLWSLHCRQDILRIYLWAHLSSASCSCIWQISFQNSKLLRTSFQWRAAHRVYIVNAWNQTLSKWASQAVAIIIILIHYSIILPRNTFAHRYGNSIGSLLVRLHLGIEEIFVALLPHLLIAFFSQQFHFIFVFFLKSNFILPLLLSFHKPFLTFVILQYLRILTIRITKLMSSLSI